MGCDSSSRSKISKDGDKWVLRLPLATLLSVVLGSFPSMAFVDFRSQSGDMMLLDSCQCVVWLYVWVKVIMQYLKKLIRSAEISQILKPNLGSLQSGVLLTSICPYATQASSRYIESNTNTVTPLLDILNYRPIFSLFGDSNSIPALNCSSYESLSRETDPGL